jgi:hypothetical protein
MMSLDEAIQHCLEKAEEEKKKLLKVGDTYACSKCAEQHEQLAEWLQELKNYRKQEKMTNVLFLPCELGSDVYCIEETIECKYDYSDGCPMDFKYTDCGSEEDDFITCEHQYRRPTIVHRLFELNMLDKFAKTVFLTLEEAKEKLKEMECAE